MTIKIKHKRGTASSITTANPTLAAGELAFETDTRRFKVGDGTTAWSSLSYVTPYVTATDRILGRSSAGAGAAEEISCTSFGRSLIGSADAAAARSTLSVQPTASPTFTGTVNAAAVTLSGVLLVTAGSASACSVGFSGDPNTGLFSSGADSLSIVTDSSERIIINSVGRVGIGANPTGNSARVIVGGGIGDAFSSGIASSAQAASGNTSRFDSFLSFPTANTGGTLTDLNHFAAFQNTFTSTVTNQYGFFASSGLTGATNNYGFYSDIATASNRWNFYAAGSAKNYFNGETLIGTTTDNGAYLLQVNSQIYATNATIATSDARFKTNVESLTDATSVIAALRPVAFDFIPHAERNFAAERQVGLIAQEAQAALAGTDYADSVVAQCGDHLGLAYEKLVPVLVKALQESNARIAALEERLNHA